MDYSLIIKLDSAIRSVECGYVAFPTGQHEISELIRKIILMLIRKQRFTESVTNQLRNSLKEKSVSYDVFT